MKFTKYVKNCNHQAYYHNFYTPNAIKKNTETENKISAASEFLAANWLTRTWWCLAWPRGAASAPSSQARSWHKRLSLAGWHWGFRFETRWDRPTPQGLEHTDHCEYSCLQSGGCCAAIISYHQCIVCWN